MASLEALREEVEAFCRARALALADEAGGKSPLADLGAVDRAHPSVVSPDTAAAVRALLSSERTPEPLRPRLRALVAFLRQAALEAGARAEDEALRRLRNAPRTLAGVTCSLREVWDRVALEPDRLRRAALAREATEAELEHRDAVQRRWEATVRRAEDASLSRPAGAVGDDALQAGAAELLRSTEDIWRDVLAYALRRLEGRLRPLPAGDAELHDLLRLGAEALPGAFPPAGGLEAVRRWLLDCGLGLEAGGRLRLVEGIRPRAEAFTVEIPGDVRLMTPGARDGHGPLPWLLAAAGRARASAATAAGATLEARRLGDAAVQGAPSWVFRGVLRSERWLRRYLGHGRRAAREVARLSALVQLGELRLDAARLPLMRELPEAGPGPAALEDLTAAVSRALHVRVAPGALLPDLGTLPAAGLRAAALAARIERVADERFDAEEFRNPGAARWLAGLWARGSELDAEALAEDLGGGRLELAETSARLVAVLGA